MSTSETTPGWLPWALAALAVATLGSAATLTALVLSEPPPPTVDDTPQAPRVRWVIDDGRPDASYESAAAAYWGGVGGGGAGGGGGATGASGLPVEAPEAEPACRPPQGMIEGLVGALRGYWSGDPGC